MCEERRRRESNERRKKGILGLSPQCPTYSFLPPTATTDRRWFTPFNRTSNRSAEKSRSFPCTYVQDLSFFHSPRLNASLMPGRTLSTYVAFVPLFERNGLKSEYGEEEIGGSFLKGLRPFSPPLSLLLFSPYHRLNPSFSLRGLLLLLLLGRSSTREEDVCVVRRGPLFSPPLSFFLSKTNHFVLSRLTRLNFFSPLLFVDPLLSIL